MKLYFETPIKMPYEKIKDRFNHDLFIYLSPKFFSFNLKRFDGCKKGDQFHIQFGPDGFSQDWIGQITFEETNASGWSFIDEGKVLPWPLKYWKHHHRVDRISATESRIVDDIHYECSPAFLSVLLRPVMWSVFAIRPKRYLKYFKD